MIITKMPRRGLGLVAEDVASWAIGYEPVYRDLLQDIPAQIRQVQGFQRYCQSRGIYSGPIDGYWSPATEAAWQALMPNAAGPTTPRMLEGLRVISANFATHEIQLAIAVSRDAWLRTQGIYRDVPLPGVVAESSTIRAWDPVVDPAGLEVNPSDGNGEEPLADEGDDPGTPVDANTITTAAPGAGATPYRMGTGTKVLLMALGVALLGGISYGFYRNRRWTPPAQAW